MDARALKDYQERWRAIAAVEELEQQQASFTLRWRQLNSIVRMAAALELTPVADNSDEEEVWQRWNLLRDDFIRRG